MKMYAGESGRSSFETWVTMEKAEKPGEICARDLMLLIKKRIQK